MINELRKQKKEIRNEIRKQPSGEKRQILFQHYKATQEKIKEQLSNEKSAEVSQKFERIMADKTGHAFWREKKSLTQNPLLNSLTVKNKDGIRQYDPTAVKETMADYFENLYKAKQFPYHPHHQTVTRNIVENSSNYDFEETRYNQEPTIEELATIVREKKNGKSTPDVKNEMIKRPGQAMIEILYPLVQTIWRQESTPPEWNTGYITALWKGKGDKENLTNYRGITTSSAIGTIVESMIDKRIESAVPFTQAQGGGKRGASTCDHLFLLRCMIDISKKQKRSTYLTFYDVSKAYDNVDNDDMLDIMWDSGLRGKSWRILRNLNQNLKAVIKTKYGLTRTINMEIGGKQGSRLTGRMFAKLMDTLAEELQPTGEGFQINANLKIAVLLWVDDVVSCVEGANKQEQMLQKIADFATKHKLKWGASKCKVMKVGKHQEKERKWRLGELTIEESETYKYLGDTISNDGKNAKNLEQRKAKLFTTTTSINAIAESDVLRRVEAAVILELHEKINIPALLINSESWNLN